MANKFLGQAVFFLHGEKKHTNVFPELTEEGTKTIKKASILIPFINGDVRAVTMFSSVSAEALDSADIIKKELGIKTDIKATKDISAIEIKDKKRAKELFVEISQGGPQALAIAYGTDPRFEDGVIVEPRSEVKKRFFCFFSDLINWFVMNMGSAPCIIAISHYEVLYHLVETVFGLDCEKDMPLGYGEFITTNVYKSGVRDEVEIEIIFRKKTVKISFDYKKREIV
jgi:broad specificity phosphatase PhoE